MGEGNLIQKMYFINILYFPQGGNESRTKPSKKYLEFEKKRKSLMKDYEQRFITRSYYLHRLGAITLKTNREAGRSMVDEATPPSNVNTDQDSDSGDSN